MSETTVGPEAFVREALLAASVAFGIPFTADVKPRSGAGRTGFKVLLTPGKPSVLVGRRWGHVAQALQSLLEAGLSAKGVPEAAVEVVLVEGPVAAELPTSEEPGLVAAARAVASQAVTLGRAFALGPMSAVERRLVHQALGDLPEVWTQSEGEGIFRRLWVVPRTMMSRRSAPAAPRADLPSASETPAEPGAPRDPRP
jgi:predicted RNA-binding protein Jag